MNTARHTARRANALLQEAKFVDFIEEFNHQKINPGTSLAGKAVSVKDVERGIRK